MPDYLEQLLKATALLSQVRRLEDRAALPAGERQPEEEHDAPARRSSHRRETAADRSGAEPEAEIWKRPETEEPAEELPDLRENRMTFFQSPEETEAEEELVQAPPDAGADREKNFSLLESLERLERAEATLERGGASPYETAAPGGIDAGQGKYPLSLTKPGGRFPGLDLAQALRPGERREWEETAPAAGETLNWVEQIDQVFRRDSRRYDGGFRLY